MDNYEKLTIYYEKYISPTLKKQQRRSSYKKVNIVEKSRYICKLKKLNYLEVDGKIILGDKELEIVKTCFENIYKLCNNENEFYKTEDIAKIFSLTEKKARIVVRKNFACFFRGSNYAYKENIDKIAASIDGYIEKHKIMDIIKQKLENKNISVYFIEHRMKKNVETIKHPFKDIILYKKDDIDKVLKIIENDLNNLIKETEEKEKKMIFKKEKGKTIEIKKNKALSEEYYTLEEMFKIFVSKEVYEIAQKIGYYYYENNYFFKKEEIAKIIEEVENFITMKECVEELKTDNFTVKKNFKKLNMKVYKGGEVIGLSYILRKNGDMRSSYTNKLFVRKIDKDVLKNNRQSKMEIQNTKNLYEKFTLKIENIQYSDDIKNTINYYKQFVKMRLEINKKAGGVFFSIYKILVENLYKEITNYNDKEIKELLEKITKLGEQKEITNFINYVKEKYLTKYEETYKYKKDRNTRIEPYSKKQWIEFGGLIFDLSKDSFKCQLEKALSSRSNAMIWLYCALHYVCTWRKEDILTQIPNIKLEILGLNEHEFIDTIKNGSFDINMAQIIVNEFIKDINTFHKTPNKTTKNGKGKAFLKITIQKSYVFVIGLLLGLCEAYRRISYRKSEHLLTKKVIYSYKNYVELFGEKYSELFGENFSNTRAIKSHLQYGKIFIKKSYNNHLLSVYSGYNLMSILKSHSKINASNEITDTTEIYLMSQLNEFDFDKVMFCIEERGTFGYLYHQMSKIILGESYTKQSIENQNELIFKELQMNNAVQIEKISKNIIENRQSINEMLNKLLINKNTQSEISVKDVLISLAKGEYPSKMEYSQCILKVIDSKKCMYPNRTDCIGCQYLMPEILFLIEFNEKLNKLLENIKKSFYDFDKQRYIYTLNNIYIPILAEAINYLGVKRVDTFINRKELYLTLKDLELIQVSSIRSEK